MRSCVESHYPILYFVTFEEDKADRIIKALAKGRKVFEWNMARGIVDFRTKAPMVVDYLDLPDALENWLDQELNGHFLVIRDAHLALRENPLAVARLKALVGRIIQEDDTLATIFLVSSQSYVPLELEKFITIFDTPYPDEDEIGGIIRDYAADYGLDVRDDAVSKLTLALRGLSEYEIVRLLNRGYQRDGTINADDVNLIVAEKEQIVRKSATLELVSVVEGLNDVGGLEALKKWLKQKASIMVDLPGARAFGVETPKGAMVVGMPGCGKSLTAKAASSLFELPLLRLDVGSLMGKYVGESELKMRRALKLAEAVSPCVLWVDELEKAFTGIGGTGSEVTNRLFGYFLTWMQERANPVFVLATANDISVLPPELLRKGRFDEIFYVDIPTEDERTAILHVHLEKRKKLKASIDIRQLAQNTTGFSGADLESVVNEAIEQAFVDGKAKLTTGRLLRKVKETTPLMEMMKEKVEKHQQKFLEMKIKSAS